MILSYILIIRCTITYYFIQIDKSEFELLNGKLDTNNNLFMNFCMMAYSDEKDILERNVFKYSLFGSRTFLPVIKINNNTVYDKRSFLQLFPQLKYKLCHINDLSDDNVNFEDLNTFHCKELNVYQDKYGYKFGDTIFFPAIYGLFGKIVEIFKINSETE